MSVNTKVNGQLVKSAGLYRVATPIGMADIYSTEEKEVGLWINNKPLYKKSFVFDTVVTATSNAWVDTGVDIANTVAIDAEAVLYQSNGNSIVIECNIGVDGSIYVLNPRSVNMDINALTVRYTKTTDTPWSGKFVPQGYGYVSSGDIYSLEERQVGVFVDGKPLYQKTIDCGTLPNNSRKEVAHNIANIDTVVSSIGIMGNGTSFAFIPYVSTGTQYQVPVDVNKTNIVITTGQDRSGFTGYVTIKYTKTTDVAGSGEYVPSGDKAEHYSTNEEVIGTWIDGSTLYRKTFDIGNLLNNGTKTVAHGISNLKYVVNWSGTCYSTADAGYCRPIPLSDTTATNTIRLDVGDGNINIKTASDWSAYKAFVTLEYTKTS